MEKLRKISSCTLLTEVSAYHGHTNSEKQTTPRYRNFDEVEKKEEESDFSAKYSNLQISVNVCDDNNQCYCGDRTNDLAYCKYCTNSLLHNSPKTTSESGEEVAIKDGKLTCSADDMTCRGGGYYEGYDEDDDVFHRYHNRRRILSSTSLDFFPAERLVHGSYSTSGNNSSASSPSTPQHRILQIIESSVRKSSIYSRTSSYEPNTFSPIRDEQGTNLVRMKQNASLGNSDPSLSTSCNEIGIRKFSTYGISPRRPRSLLPHSPSPPRAPSPALNESPLDSSKCNNSSLNHSGPSFPIAFHSNKRLSLVNVL